MTNRTPVEHALRRLVADGVTQGTLGPGARLPTERELVDELAAPRSTVRRALDALEQDGIVVRQVGRGTFLADVLHPAVVTAPANTSPAEIMAARRLLEPQLAALAARAATQADLERIEGCLRRGGAAADARGFEEWDSALHRAIALGTHNGLLMTLFDTMNAARMLPVWGGLKRRSSTPERRLDYHADHRAIVVALRERDADAARDRMREHLSRVSEHLLGGH
jgi:DNA-binding FadR family transcriptional regulator